MDLSIDEAIAYAIEVHRAGDVAQAEAIYEQVLQLAPDHVDALHFLAIVQHQRGRSEDAIDLLARAIELKPEHPDLYNNRGNVLKLLGQLDEAEASYRKALALRPNDPDTMNNLGAILRERGCLEDAAAAFRMVIDMQPDHYEAHQNLGGVLVGLCRFEEALEAHRRALDLRPRGQDAYRHLGAVYYALGLIDEAAAVYRQWLAVSPLDPVATHLLAACTNRDVPERASDEFICSTFDNYATTFDKSLAQLQYRAPSLVAAAVAEIAQPTQQGIDVLDAGCGTGLCAEALRRYARRLTGVDLSECMLARASERDLYDELVHAELTSYLRQHAGTFSLIVAADTLVYFGPLDVVFSAAAQALCAGGHFVFTLERSTEVEAPLGFRIHPHGRYSHSETYVRHSLNIAGMDTHSVRVVELRKEAGSWVSGLLVTAHR